jgi:hypothetical protein
MSYNLFLDDQRNPSDGYLHDSRKTLFEASGVIDWVVVRDYEEFVKMIDTRGIPDRVSFDHDLQFEHVRYFVEHTISTGFIEYANFNKKTGKGCAEYLMALVKKLDYPCPICYVHSANHVGRKNIAKVLFDVVGNNYMT